jgi:predicted NUDIX family phosphoesterase
MSNPKWEEQIVAVKRADVFNGEEDTFQGVLTDSDKLEEISLRFETYDVIRRGHANDPTPKENNAEINFDYKQPIPYIVIRRGDEFFAYKRLSGSGESRLVNKVSIGLGGHMNAVEGAEDFGSIVWENMLRELSEEVIIEAEGAVISTVGLINDDSDDVGKVHIGILMSVKLELTDNVSVNETDQLAGEWMTKEQLLAMGDKLENWTQIALTVL